MLFRMQELRVLNPTQQNQLRTQCPATSHNHTICNGQLGRNLQLKGRPVLSWYNPPFLQLCSKSHRSPKLGYWRYVVLPNRKRPLQKQQQQLFNAQCWKHGIAQYSPLSQMGHRDVPQDRGMSCRGTWGFSLTLKCSPILGQLASIRQLVLIKKKRLFSRTYTCILAPSWRKQETLQLAPHERQPAEAVHLHVDLCRAVWAAAFPCRAGGKGCSEVTVLTVRAWLFSWQRRPFVLLINGFAGGR